jgi:hypothetical protein
MEIPVPILSVFLACILGLQGWILKKLVDLELKLAVHVASPHPKPDDMKQYKLPLAVLIAAFIPLLFFLGCAEAHAQDTNALWIQTNPTNDWVRISRRDLSVFYPMPEKVLTEEQYRERIVNDSVAPSFPVAQPAKVEKPLIPERYAEALTLGLGLLSFWLHQKGSKRKRLLRTVIAGVEAASNPEVKKRIRDASKIHGTESELHKAVKDETDK